MSAPARIQRMIEEVAEAFEVPADDIMSRQSYRAVNEARMECYRRALKTPKPNGKMPTIAEVARWLDRSWDAVQRAVKEVA